jgi:hypothetical protein
MFAKRVLSGICISSSITRRLEGNIGVGWGQELVCGWAWWKSKARHGSN